MVCGDPQEGSGRQRHDHLCKSMSDMSVVFGCGIMWHPWHHEARKFLQAGLDKTMYNQYQLSFKTHSSSYIFIYIFILYCPYSEIYLDIICNDLITLVPTKVQCEVSSCHWISYPSFKSHGWVPLPSKNLLPTSALNNSLHRHHKQCRSKGAWQLLPATQVRSWVGVTSERDAAYTRGQVDKRTRPGHKHRERASKIQ